MSEPAGGLEALQREWTTLSKRPPHLQPDGDTVYEICADALAPHIAAAKEREEKLWAVHQRMIHYIPANTVIGKCYPSCTKCRLAAILAGGDDGTRNDL